jgi:acyl-coenzyme A thioesterase PaaI-like protein
VKVRADRPMSEHEGALFSAVYVLGMSVLELGADPKVLRGRLSEEMRRTKDLGNVHGAATLGFLIDALFGASQPGPKPFLRIV